MLTSVNKKLSHTDNLVLPKSVNGYPVVEVNILSGTISKWSQGSVNRFIIPEGVKRLKGSVNLRSGTIYLPLSLKSIDSDVFRKTDCYVIYNDLQFLPERLSESAKKEWDEEFNGFIKTYPAKSTVTIPAVIDKKVPSGIPSKAAKKIEGMYIRYVGDGYNIFNTYNGNSGSKETTVKTLNISEGIEAIGTGAFVGSTKLSKVSLPKTLTRIESMAFKGCSSLKSITLPNTALMIDSAAFSGTGITSITIPSKLRSLNDRVGVNKMGGVTREEAVNSAKYIQNRNCKYGNILQASICFLAVVY